MPRADSSPATTKDIHAFAQAMPHVTRDGSDDNPVYQVGGKSFVFFRTPRPDAVDADGTRYEDVVVIWVPSPDDKLALVQADGPFFTTPHFDGHPSVLIRESELNKITCKELREVIQDAWLARASAARGKAWLAGSESR